MEVKILSFLIQKKNKHKILILINKTNIYFYYYMDYKKYQYLKYKKNYKLLCCS